jgi:membrane-associated phospholipid phosphatase
LLSQIHTGDDVLYLNSQRTSFWDTFFIYGTQLAEEKVYLLIIFSMLFLRVRDSVLFTVLGGIVMLISVIAKAYFLHDRPYVYFSIHGLMTQIHPVEGVKLLVGKTSFPSGHTTGAFALFGLLAFLLSKRINLGWLFFGLALIVAFSRMYLIQHFFKDVYAGSILGLAIAILFYQLQLLLPDDKSRWWNRSILELRSRSDKIVLQEAPVKKIKQ